VEGLKSRRVEVKGFCNDNEGYMVKDSKGRRADAIFQVNTRKRAKSCGRGLRYRYWKLSITMKGRTAS